MASSKDTLGRTVNSVLLYCFLYAVDYGNIFPWALIGRKLEQVFGIFTVVNLCWGQTYMPLLLPRQG